MALGLCALLSWWGPYETWMTVRYGATLGKRWRRIEVVRMGDLATRRLVNPQCAG